jgi:hypothetical protein
MGQIHKSMFVVFVHGVTLTQTVQNKYHSDDQTVLFSPDGGGGSSTQAWMPTYVSILRVPQMI